MGVNLPAAVVALTVGAAQALLDVVLFGAAFSQKPVKMIAALLGKLAVYGGFFYLLATALRPGVVGAEIGFAAGFFPGLLVWYLAKGRKTMGGGKPD